jgi:hypothetical protein
MIYLKFVPVRSIGVKFTITTFESHCNKATFAMPAKGKLFDKEQAFIRPMFDKAAWLVL